MNRRDFLLRSVCSGAAIPLYAFPYHLFAGESKKYAGDRIQLGSTGIEVSRLAVGTGTRGGRGNSNQTRKFGLQGLGEHLRAAYDEGINFWDSADQYGSHPHLKEGLKHVLREKVVILSKTHASTEKEMWADLDRFRREIGTDYIDIILLHAMREGNWPERKRGAMTVLSEAREKGLIHAHGVSCHTLQALKVAAQTPWVQVDLARINPAGVIMDADVPTVVSVLSQMKADRKGIVGMKILGEGRLRNRVDECLQYALGLDCVHCFTIGTESRGEFLSLLKKIPAASVRG